MMKAAGNRSGPSFRVSPRSWMKMFANGVAYNPTYAFRENVWRRRRISR